MAPITSVVAAIAVVLALWLGLTAPDTTPVDPDARNGTNQNADNGGDGGNGDGGR